MAPSGASAAVSTRSSLSRLFHIANSPWPNTSGLLGNTATHDRRGTPDALRCIGGAPIPRSWQLKWDTIHSPRRQGSSGRTKETMARILRYTVFPIEPRFLIPDGRLIACSLRITNVWALHSKLIGHLLPVVRCLRDAITQYLQTRRTKKNSPEEMGLSTKTFKVAEHIAQSGSSLLNPSRL